MSERDWFTPDVQPATVAQTAWVFQHLDNHLKQGGTFRYLIYHRMGYGPEAYMDLFLAGGQNLSNALFAANYGPEVMEEFGGNWNDNARDWAEALIAIACGFSALGPDPEIVTVDGVRRAVPNGCAYCHTYFEEGCDLDCPGRLARLALGVA